MVSKSRYKLFCKLIESFDEGCKCVHDYDALLHDYNGAILYQAESQFIHEIGQNPGITITELASLFDKTRSACSQLMRRMKNKGWLYQDRNNENNREYNLYLTEDGYKIFNKHLEFEKKCYMRTAEMLSGFSDDELKIYMKVQNELNNAFKVDVEESKVLKVVEKNK